MKAIILGAGQGIIRQNEQDSIPKCLLTDPFGQTALDWIINSFHLSGINNITFIGGFHIEKVIQKYPRLKYYVNSNWDHTNMLESLFCAKNELKGQFLVSFSDVVCRPSVIQKLLDSKADVAITVDRNWRKRYAGRVNDLLSEADKVVVKKGRVVRIGKKMDSEKDIWGEFTGFALFNKTGAKALRESYLLLKEKYLDRPFHEASNISTACLNDIMQELINTGLNVENVDIHGDWAELDAPQDLAQFVFGTKAETLERLSPMIKKAMICDHLIITIEEWNSSSLEIIKKIKSSFKPKPVVVRSSALDEDSWNESNAGKYCSVLDVESSDKSSISSAINQVIESYRKYSPNGADSDHQILIQPKLQNVAMSGVLLTRTVEYRAPYFVINYDDQSMLTDTVTSGVCENLKIINIFKKTTDNELKFEPFVHKLINMAKELEQFVGYDSLDIEFAMTDEESPYILQVRPIAAHKNVESIDDQDIIHELEDIKKFVSNRLSPKPHYYGETSILGVMPDWNPAEIIGLSPKPLALSLYQFLITDKTWAEARAMIGYKNMVPEPLLYSLGGRPYIDTRISFNSFLPKDLSEILSEKIVNYYVIRLKEEPELHDKIEFEIVHSCFLFDTKKKLKFLKNYGFKQKEIDVFEETLLKLTNNILSGNYFSIEELENKLKILNQRRNSILKAEIQEEQIPYVVNRLLYDCISYGTLPFSILARYAFVGTAILKSFVSENIISDEEYHMFLNSIPTVATNFIDDLSKFKSNELTLNDFLEVYGHLRPGTYDMLSSRYDEKPDLYLKLNEKIQKTDVATEKHNEPFKKTDYKFSSKQIKNINKKLKECKISVNADELILFIRHSTQAREQAKFDFSKNLSAALKLMAKFGEENAFTKDDLSFIPIQQFLRLATDNRGSSFKRDFRELINNGKNKHHMTQALCLPDLICSPDDAEYFEVVANKPNFVTQKRVVADIDIFHGIDMDTPDSISEKIVLIENADPGFDWIFGHNIKGLITMYGGAASHMAIRAAEFGLPAAIGCGKSIFDTLSNARKIELNCSSKQIRVVD